jgi:hypothetical protein
MNLPGRRYDVSNPFSVAFNSHFFAIVAADASPPTLPFSSFFLLLASEIQNVHGSYI